MRLGVHSDPYVRAPRLYPNFLEQLDPAARTVAGIYSCELESGTYHRRAKLAIIR